MFIFQKMYPNYYTEVVLSILNSSHTERERGRSIQRHIHTNKAFACEVVIISHVQQYVPDIVTVASHTSSFHP